MNINPYLIDSHCHLDFPALKSDLPMTLKRMQENGVGAALCIGVNLEDFPALHQMVIENPALYASVGIHPEYTDVEEASEERLSELAALPKVIGIGETGLDYYWHKDRPVWQRQRFRTHIRVAKKMGKPLIIHMREATEDTLLIMKEEGAAAVGGIMHCFTESWSVAKDALDLGFHLSFSGIVTFKNALQVKEVARQCPLDRLLIETDSPYLAPAPHRGKQNEPAYVRYVAEEIARLRGVDFSEIAAASTQNFLQLFRINH